MVLILLLEVCFPSYNLLFDQLLGGGAAVCLSVCLQLVPDDLLSSPPVLSMC